MDEVVRHVLMTPTLHRWHHAVDEVGKNCNFGSNLALWDQLFGTFYLPKASDRALPERVGLREGVVVPKTYWAHLMLPFRWARHTGRRHREGCRRHSAPRRRTSDSRNTFAARTGLLKSRKS